MALTINTNVSALIAQQTLSVSNSQLTVSVQRLSSGYRVNSAADDAAGLGRADQLRSQSRMIQASIRNIHAGDTATLTMYIGCKNSSNDQLGISLNVLTSGTSGLNLTAGVISTQAGALAALDSVSAAVKKVNDARAIYGASTNRLSAALSNLQVTYTNFQAGESRIRDADFAFETAPSTRNQIMVQAGTSVLAQANQAPQNVLSLLR